MSVVFNLKQTNLLNRKFAADATDDCLLHFTLENNFYFRRGNDCKYEAKVNEYGAGITKAAIKEMVGRFKKSRNNPVDNVCIDYGKKVLLNILGNESCEGIRFYFGKHDIVNRGNNITSLILVPIDKDGNEMFGTGKHFFDMGDEDEGGSEVGHGNDDDGISKAKKEKYAIYNSMP